MFRRAPGSETTFVEQNQTLVYKCGLRCWERASEQAEKKTRFVEPGPQNLNF